MKRAIFLLSAIAVLAAGCGSSGGVKLGATDIAVVGSKHITQMLFDELMSEAKANYKLQGQTFPKAGTTEFSAIKSQAVTILVQQAETEVEAGKLGITVTDKDIENQLTQIKTQCCAGKEAKYRAELKKQGLTDQEVRDNARSIVYGQKLTDKLTADLKVTPTAITAYYVQHQSEFQTPASRDLRYILLGKNKASLAQTLFQQLTGAGDSAWCTLAKKYSKDPSSAGSCGKATFTQGQTVAEFDKLAFSLATKKVATVNTKQYGWFVLQPTAATKPAAKTSVTKAGKQIEQTILQTKKQEAITAWTQKTQKAYCKGGQITYKAGYQPSPDPCAATGTTTT